MELSRYIHLNPVRAGIVEKPEDYFNSSYQSYIRNQKDEIVHHDQILQMISNDKKAAPRLYKEFVKNGIRDDLENPFANIHGGAILGKETFIKQALGRLKTGTISSKETSHRKKLESSYQSDVIINGVSNFYNIKEDAILNDGKEYRNICIYLMKKYTGMTNVEIGQLFNGLSFSAVSKVHQRMTEAIKEDRKMRKSIDKIVSILS